MLNFKKRSEVFVAGEARDKHLTPLFEKMRSFRLCVRQRRALRKESCHVSRLAHQVDAEVDQRLLLARIQRMEDRNVQFAR